ncbi:proton-coupled amino acid transporter-like protein CG1139 isoform X2 [Halyomorpha halys]
MPECFKNAGLFSGTIILCISAVIIIHCMLLIVTIQNDRAKMMKVPIVTYGQAMKFSLEGGPMFFRPLAPVSLFIIDIYLSAYHLGTCIVYAVFMGVNVKQIFDEYVFHLDERLWMLIIMPFEMLLNCLRDLKVLAPVSTLANIIMFTGIGIIMYYVFIDLPGIEGRNLFGTPLTWPGILGTATFSLSPVALVLTLESQMKTPQSYGGWFGVLNIGMVCVTLLNVFVAYFGYQKYGEDTLSSLSLNIPQDSIIAHVVRCLYSLVIYMTYAVQFYVPYDIIWHRYTEPKVKSHTLLWDYVFKMSMVIVTFLMAIGIPLLGLFLSLVGALRALMSIVFPALMSICHYYPDRYGPYKIYLWKDILVFIAGMGILLCGTVSCIYNIVISLKKYHEDKAAGKLD